MNSIKFVLLLVCLFPLAGNRQVGKVVGSSSVTLKIMLHEPKSGWTQDRMVVVSGEMIPNQNISPVTVSINGDKYYIDSREGRFRRSFPVTSGKNSILASVQNKAGTFSAERTVYAQVPPVPILLILTSDTDGVYTDLHVYEPSANGKAEDQPSVHVYWADVHSPTGGRFYLNSQEDSYDKPGYGPYLYTHQSPPLGVYRIDANYWPSGDKAHTVGTLNITLFGGTSNEQKRVVKQPLITSGQTITLAWIKIEREQVAHIYVPSLDKTPDPSIWPKFVK